MLIFLRSIYHIVTSKELIESKQRREEFRKAKQDFNSKVFKKVYGKDLMCNISEADGERFIKASFVEKVEDECLRSLMVENLMEDFFDQVKNDIKTIDIRIGVVSNTLLQLKLKERAKQQEEKANGGHALKKLLENDYEMEI